MEILENDTYLPLNPTAEFVPIAFAHDTSRSVLDCELCRLVLPVANELDRTSKWGNRGLGLGPA
jgi:hypothetical protein